MNSYNNLNQGVYFVQSGYRNDTAIIECPYVSHRIEVYDAHGLKILHGAQVYWTEVRRQIQSKRKGSREIINAVVVGIKYCPYICDGKQILCTLKITQDTQGIHIQGIPVNHRLPPFDVAQSPFFQDQNLSYIQIRKQLEERYYWAQILCWNYEEKHPKGSILSVFQKDYKTPEAEGEVLLHCLQISDEKTTFNHSRLLSKSKHQQYLPIKNHKQFHSMVFTIDPKHSVDIEDGLSLQSLGNGLYELGIHISDVSSFKHLINRIEIAKKATSTYLPHKTIHMLPPELVQLLALKSKKRRLAFTAFFKIDIEGKIIEKKFQKTIVQSVAQLSYEQAQDIMDGSIDSQKFMKDKDLTNTEYLQMNQKLLILRTVAANRRKRRNNTQIFDKNEVIFQLDQNNIPINIGVKKRIESQKLVEEFMIMTNCQVAKKLVQDFGVHSLIIYHPKPLDYNIQHLNDYVSQLGVKFRVDDMMHLEKDFQDLFEKQEINDGLKQLLLLKAIQIQEYAIYTRYLNTYKGHFGLSLEYYTHFTSPVRRFADLMVHEQLQKCINGQQLKNVEIVQLQEEIELINRARARNKRLKQSVVECFINLYLYMRREKIRTKGFIIRLGLRSATIYVPIYNLIKDVNWNQSTAYIDKDKIQLEMHRNGVTIVKEFQKNDSLDVQISSEIHQEVQLNLIIKHNNQEIKI